MNATLGTGTLARLALRRERGTAPWWILLIVSLSLVMVAYINRNMGTYELKLTYLKVIAGNPFLRAIGGGVVEPRLDVLATWRSGGFLYLASALAALMSVIRHTRREEDAGRSELVLAGRVGRAAPLTAALLVAGGTSLIGGALTAAALIGAGLEPAGSLTYGGGIAVAGWMFGGIAAVAAQLSRNAHTATVIALTALGAAYVLRFAADVSGQAWLKYLSPVGWVHLVEPYQSERWWLLGVCVLVSAILYGAAYRLLARRDLGSGLLPERLGPESAPELRGPVSLAWRLHRALLLKWLAGVAVFALLGGALTAPARDLVSRPSIIVDNITHFLGIAAGEKMVAGYLWYLILIIAYAVALYPVLMIVRLRAEETSGRAEALHATPMTRLRWASGHLLVTALGTAALMAVAGLAFGVIYSLAVGHLLTDAPAFLAGALSTVPAAWCVGAVCLLAYGLLPRAAVVIAWLAWLLTTGLGQVVGPLYGLWGGSPAEPFHHIPNAMLATAFPLVPVTALLAITTLLTGAGLLALRHRDFGT
ncbi:polyketide antibiotic transporter [Nonomuraea sp. FMUSA5-5]|uniref:Polyketide antibiotic transporter n=1 Tax=Nonomuraea composti TaxID=2720023 RepID=A0ABX1B0J6_9ACTN|nr:polyketide antibiotic transporter [Nonomuraea sp. FMUSA5-5]NJP89977.1 polyketide antibiotic transporter [Nonomuraea sp. FMUSA5-5]